MQGLPRLTIEERILLVLVEHLRFIDEFQVPSALTQDGLSELIDVNRPNIARSLKALKRKGMIEERLSHVQGQRRRKKVYLISPARTEAAVKFRSELGSMEVTYDGRVTTLDGLRTGSGMTLVEAYMLIMGKGGQRPPPTAQVPGQGPYRTFFGRKDELARLRAWSREEGVPIAVVCGMGGIGKTALMDRFISSSKEVRPLTFRFVQGSSFKGSLHSLEVLLKVPGLGSETEPRDIAMKLAKALSGGSLLVLDDLHLAGKEFDNVLRALLLAEISTFKLLVATRKKRTFYTAREASVHRKVIELQLEGLSERDSLELLRSRGFDDGSSSLLYRRSKGYPIALVLTPVGDIKAGEEFGHDAESFLNTEVLSRLPSEELKALRLLSVLRVPCPAAYTLLKHASMDPVNLDELISRGMVSQGTYGYEVHPVLSEVVRSRTNGKELASLHSEAARFHLKNNRTTPGTIEALYHLAKAGDQAGAFSVLRSKGMYILEEGYLELLYVLEGLDPEGASPENRAWYHLLLGAGEYGMNEPSRAMNELRRASAEAEKARTSDGSFVLSLNTIKGRVLLDIGSPGEAEACFRRAGKAFDREIHLEELDLMNGAWAHNGLGLALKARGDLDGALSAFRGALEVCGDLDPGNMAPSILGNIAMVHLLRREYDEAITTLEKALRMSDALKDLQTSARLHETLGEVNVMVGEGRVASEHFERALELASSGEEMRKTSETYLSKAASIREHLPLGQRIAAFLGGRGKKDMSELARTYNRICRIEREKDRVPSPEVHGKAAALFSEAGMDRMAGKAYNNLGYSLMLRGQKEEAMKAFRDALEPLKRTGDERGEAITLFNLANLMHDKGDTAKAIDIMGKAASLMEESGMAKEGKAAARMLKQMRGAP